MVGETHECKGGWKRKQYEKNMRHLPFLINSYAHTPLSSLKQEPKWSERRSRSRR